ncbi:erythromycin esterase family protein [Kribbella sp. NPDC056345]|uniref:erythromycin esterase family protein n=1 Tax=Kribbella sp. NPDC056345 TaxID=3345789 RepID=UPI0035D590D7
MRSSVRSWIRETALELPDPGDGTGWDTALRSWLPKLAEVRVVGVGEATHGTREFFQLKHQLFRYLVKHAGFRVFAIEACASEAPAVDAYVRGTSRENGLAQLGFWTWQTEEVLALLNWMREYNDGLPYDEQLQFVGVDPQMPNLSIEAAESLLETTTGPEAELIRQHLEVLKAPEAVRTAEQAAKSTYAVRDRLMADAVEKLSQDAKVFFWGHNGHIAAKPYLPGAPSTGQVLHERLGASYYAVGLLFGRGSLRAFRGMPTKKAEPAVIRTGRPVPWSAEAALGRVLPAGCHLLDLRDAPDWFTEDRWTRSFGAVATGRPVFNFGFTSLSTAYDAIAYLPESTPSRPL